MGSVRAEEQEGTIYGHSHWSEHNNPSLSQTAPSVYDGPSLWEALFLAQQPWPTHTHAHLSGNLCYEFLRHGLPWPCLLHGFQHICQ